MDGDADGGFFADRRREPLPAATYEPVPTRPPDRAPSAGALHRSPSRSPFFGIVAVMTVTAGLAITMLGGNQGGLVGMPVLLIGTILGAVAYGRNLGRVWGLIAALALPAFVALAVLSEVVRLGR